MGKIKNAYSIFVGESKGWKSLGCTGLDGKIILKLILKYRFLTGFIWLRMGINGGFIMSAIMN
jgi:hypothetical protein